MSGIVINGVNHVVIMNDNLLKDQSLEDNAYFTLLDIFWNGNTQQCRAVHEFKKLLTAGNDALPSRSMIYTDVMYNYNSDFTQRLYTWLVRLASNKHTMFNFNESCGYEEGDVQFMKFDDWFDQLTDLIKKLEEQLDKLNKWKTVDAEYASRFKSDESSSEDEGWSEYIDKYDI
jgi:hypothetical protein